MSSQRALVWGAKGWIGSQFCEVLQLRGWSVIAAESRAENQHDVIAEIERIGPSHCISAIGCTHGHINDIISNMNTIDYLEQPGKLYENMRDNLYGPINLANACRDRGIHLLYLGSGSIFDYDDEHVMPHADLDISGIRGFSETDHPTFCKSAYSTVKGFTDRIMSEQFADVCLNVRIRMPISSQEGPRNFLNRIIQYILIHNVPNSMTVLDDILPCLVDCMERCICGTLNAVNPGVLDHRTILQWYKELQNPGHTWVDIDRSLLESRSVRCPRSNCYLETQRLEELFPSIRPIGESVRHILENHRFSPRKKLRLFAQPK